MKAIIKSKKNIANYYETIKFQAYDGRGKSIFGAKSECWRDKKSPITGKGKNGKWIPSWGTGASDTFEGKEIEYACIKKAMEYCKKQNKKI